MAGQIPGTSIHGGTFQFKSHYPSLHMPAIAVQDTELVDPFSSKGILDGELVRLGEGTSEGGAAVVGSQRLHQILAANLPIVTVGGGNDDDTIAPYVDGARKIDVSTEIRITHGRKGRGERQFHGMIPTVLDYDFEFKYRLLDDNGTYANGVKLFPYIIANANLPAAVRAKTTRDVAGLVPESVIAALGDANINGETLPYFAVCRSSKDSAGWITAVLKPGVWTIEGATN